MLKRTIFLFSVVLLLGSCLKEEDALGRFDFIDAVDTQGIEIYLKSHKPGEDKDKNPILEECQWDDPQSLWNTRRQEPVLPNTPYEDLVGKAFKDTNTVKMIRTEGDTISVPIGSWIYINKRGAKIEQPVDSSAVLVKYLGTLLTDRTFDVQAIGSTMYLKSGTIIGFKYGMTYFEPGKLSVTQVVPEPDEDGKQDPPYEKVEYIENGQGWILIPSRSAYGNVLSSDIPPNSTLVFNIHLLAVANYPKPEDPEENNTQQFDTRWFNFSKIPSQVVKK